MTKAITLVTGASRGLGAALAELISGKDTHIIALARTAGALEELDDRIRRNGGSASLAVMDICAVSSLEGLARQLRERWGRIDLLIHSAVHAPALSPVAHGDEKDLEKALRTNVLATERLIACCDPLLKNSDRSGAVFFDDAQCGRSFFGRYGSAKAAQIALARSWKSESRRLGISVQIVRPRPMRTLMRARFFPGEDRSRLADPMEEAVRITAELRSRAPRRFGWLPQ